MTYLFCNFLWTVHLSVSYTHLDVYKRQEHDLSVIQNPKQHSKGRYLHYGQWIGAVSYTHLGLYRPGQL